MHHGYWMLTVRINRGDCKPVPALAVFEDDTDSAFRVAVGRITKPPFSSGEAGRKRPLVNQPLRLVLRNALLSILIK